jgi:hypothetical protein
MIALRRIAKLVVAGSLLGTTLFVGSPSAPAGPRCTLRGTSGDDHLVDTAGASVICASAGTTWSREGRRPTGSSVARAATGWTGARGRM